MKTASVREILERHSPDIRHLVEQLRALIREAVPVAEERPYRGWHGTVRLGFEHGADLPDPRGLLQPASSGANQVRYVTLRPDERIPVSELRALLRKAIGRAR